MTTQWLLQWWNLIFAVPFGVALAYLGVYTLSGWTFGDEAELDHDLDHDVDADVDHDFDADADADADVDADADADVDADADADVDHDADADADHDADSDTDSAHTAGGAGGASPAWAALTWLGVGRAPLSLLLMVLFISWGMIGFVINQGLRDRFGDSWRVALVSIPIAFVGTTLITRTIARLLGRYMPTRETYARREHELLGSIGEAMYAIDESFGMAAVRDDRGQLFQVTCRAPRGTTIDKGRRVRLVGFSGRERTFQVIADASSAAAPGGRAATPSVDDAIKRGVS